MNRVDHYLTYEYKARQRAILVSVAGGAIIGMILEGLLGLPFKSAATICCAVTGGIQLVAALSYVPRKHSQGR